MDSSATIIPLVVGGAALIVAVGIWASQLPGLWRTSRRFNSTEDWTPVPQEGQERAPTGTPLGAWFEGVITPNLETGETLEGFANALFSPPRPSDWGIKMGLDQVPLLIAVTPRRLLLFELGYLTVQRSCFIEYDTIRFLMPPKPGFLGTSGKLRFGLRSGREYQIQFTGPLFNDEAMLQEQRLAAHLQAIAPRFASSTEPDARAA